MPESAEEEKSPTLPEAGPDLTFEQAYERLEELVREMESDDLPLSTLIEAYDRGIQLHALCQSRLEDAQGRIEMIRRRADGKTVVEPFDEGVADAATKNDETKSESTDDAPSSSLKGDAELF